MREAFRRAEEERPGAIHLELPEDIADEHTDAIADPGQLRAAARSPTTRRSRARSTRSRPPSARSW